MKSRTQTGDTQRMPVVKLDVVLGVYSNGILGHIERFADLKAANAEGRNWESLGFQVMIRCGVSKLPDVYPYGDDK